MNAIARYLNDTGMSQTDFAKLAGISPGMVWQYIKDLRPVSEKVCVRIELLTKGSLTRQAMRPNDWSDIWPELQESSHA
ncbi:MAG: helix-turn-helix domain-containing protein [Candidimonas sp.]|nr:MAG: helix-turn-helix domain-containing protein [Candidimonas sp.]TAM26895.1 MAG: helix-turn-helix domain-containing protein [Candidimonas sp.]